MEYPQPDLEGKIRKEFVIRNLPVFANYKIKQLGHVKEHMNVIFKTLPKVANEQENNGELIVSIYEKPIGDVFEISYIVEYGSFIFRMFGSTIIFRDNNQLRDIIARNNEVNSSIKSDDENDDDDDDDE